jgi:hypothetical protein
LHDVDYAAGNANDLRKGHTAIVAAIAILRSAGVAVPMELHLAARVLHYALRPTVVTLQRIN